MPRRQSAPPRQQPQTKRSATASVLGVVPICRAIWTTSASGPDATHPIPRASEVSARPAQRPRWLAARNRTKHSLVRCSALCTGLKSVQRPSQDVSDQGLLSSSKHCCIPCMGCAIRGFRQARGRASRAADWVMAAAALQSVTDIKWAA